VLPKPAKGSALKAKRRRKAQGARRERQIMTQAKARDGYRCRVCGQPGTDAAHLRHRGMGGNPAGDRTTLENLVCLCRQCHNKFGGKPPIN
jgi:5-methylcytosine-specific restriction endonuclease McrA